MCRWWAHSLPEDNDMSCGCSSTTGDCSDALEPIRVDIAPNIYRPPNNTNLVDGELLIEIIMELIDKVNCQAELLNTILNPDCTLKEGTCASESS